MIAGRRPSLADLGDLSPGLRQVFGRYDGTGMLAASTQELQRLRRHLFDSCRVDPADLALFDHFPPDDRQAIARELHELVHAGMRRRQEEHAQRVAAQAPVEEIRQRLLPPTARERLVDLGIWAYSLLCDQELVERLVDTYFDLTTVERVQAFVAHQDALIAAFQRNVRRLYITRQARRRRVPPTEVPARTGVALDTAYACLGLPVSSTRDTVCRAYRRMAKLHHPDHGGNEVRMKELNQAYTLIASTWKS